MCETTPPSTGNAMRLPWFGVDDNEVKESNRKVDISKRTSFKRPLQLVSLILKTKHTDVPNAG